MAEPTLAEDLKALAHSAIAYGSARATLAAAQERSLFTSKAIGGPLIEAVTAEHEATQDFLARFAALNLRLATEGEESMQTATRTERPTISTLEEVQELPKGAVILEDQYEAAYQKRGDDDWIGESTWIRDSQIDLPCTVIYDPRNR